MSTKNPAKNPKSKGALPPHLEPGNPGNSGGKKGRSGRPPNEFRERMQELASQKNVEDYLRKCLRGEFGPKFHLSALQYATDRGYGKAAQPIEGPDGGPVEVTVTRRVVKPE